MASPEPRIHIVTRSGKLYEGDLYRMNDQETLLYLKNVTYSSITPPADEEEQQPNMEPIPLVSFAIDCIMELRDLRPWHQRRNEGREQASEAAANGRELPYLIPEFIFEYSDDDPLIECNEHVSDATLVAILGDPNEIATNEAPSVPRETVRNSSSANNQNSGSFNPPAFDPSKCMCCVHRPRTRSAPSNLNGMSKIPKPSARPRSYIPRLSRVMYKYSKDYDFEKANAFFKRVQKRAKSFPGIDEEIYVAKTDTEDTESDSESDTESESESGTASELEVESENEIESEEANIESESSKSNQSDDGNQEQVGGEEEGEESKEEEQDEEEEGAVGGASIVNEAPLVTTSASKEFGIAENPPQRGKYFYDPKQSFFDKISTRTRKHPSRLPTWRSFEINTETFGPNSVQPEDVYHYVGPEIRFPRSNRYHRSPRYRGVGRYCYVSRANSCYSASLALKNWRSNRGRNASTYSNYYRRPIMGGAGQRLVGDTSQIFSLRDPVPRLPLAELPVPGSPKESTAAGKDGPTKIRVQVDVHKDLNGVSQMSSSNEVPSQKVKQLPRAFLPNTYSEVLRIAGSRARANRTNVGDVKPSTSAGTSSAPEPAAVAPQVDSAPINRRPCLPHTWNYIPKTSKPGMFVFYDDNKENTNKHY